MNVTIIGAGYVGLTTASSLAFLNHRVVCVEKDPAKLAMLRRGQCPIHEPGVVELLALAQTPVEFTDDTESAVRYADVVMIAVGTPSKPSGEADTSYVEQAAEQIAAGFQPGRRYTVAVKSTVPIGTNRRVAQVVEKALRSRRVEAEVFFASCPEFLREGHAIHDTLYPDRIVVGSERQEAFDALRALFAPILEQTFTPPEFLPRDESYKPPVFMTTDSTSAEMIKYASNAFLAAKISFANELAGLCERVGADIKEVTRGMGLDSRIGPRFLNAGLGWGGSCFPKDTAALLAVAREYGYEMPIVEAARRVNAGQRLLIVEKLQAHLKSLRGRTIAILGLAFKPGTDDVRESPGLEIARRLVERGAEVRLHDPVATENARRALADVDVEYVDDPVEACAGCDGVVLATEWEAYRRLDLQRLARAMRSPVLIDGRNLFDPAAAVKAGFIYEGVGNGQVALGNGRLKEGIAP